MSPSNAIQVSYIRTTDDEFITVFVPGHDALPASTGHPSFLAIKDALGIEDNVTMVNFQPDVDPETLVGLFDVQTAINNRFEHLTERVTVKGGVVYFDGDPVDNSLAVQIVRFLDEGVDDWSPLVEFMEKVMLNPSEHSREQLYEWVTNQHGITITEDGDIVGYKGVQKQSDGSLTSVNSGTAIVDGEQVRGRIPNAVNSVVEMPRSSVADDPDTACSTGLHVGTFEYAQGWNQGAMLRVLVNPRDVVSVPRDGHGEKVRVCRYYVQDVIDAPCSGAYYNTGRTPDLDGEDVVDDDLDFCDFDF